MMVSHYSFLIFTHFALSDCLQAEHDRKKKMRQNKTDEQRKQRQKDLQKKFEEDLENYKEGLLQVPKQHDPDASLVITYSFSSNPFNFLQIILIHSSFTFQNRYL